MSIFGRFLRRKKVDAKQMIKDFEIGRYTLIQQVKEKSDSLKKDGYNVLEINPLLVSVGKADEKSPLGVIIATDTNTFTEFHKYLDGGKYGKSEISIFEIGEYAFLMAISMDEDKKMAIIYPSALRKEKLNEIQKETTLYIYILSTETQKYTLIYIPNIKWSEPTKIERKSSKEKSKEPSPTMYR